MSFKLNYINKLIIEDIAIFLGTVSLRLIRRSADGFVLLATLWAKNVKSENESLY